MTCILGCGSTTDLAQDAGPPDAEMADREAPSVESVSPETGAVVEEDFSIVIRFSAPMDSPTRTTRPG